MNFFGLFQKPHTVVKYVAATRHDNAKARALQIGKRLELEIMVLHAGPEKAAKARARATERLRKSVGAP